MRSKSQNIKLQIEFDDNTLLPLLFGEHNTHLANIENRLGVVLSSRGNRVEILGSEMQSKKAHDVLINLYDQAKKDQKLALADVDGVLRMADLTIYDNTLAEKNYKAVETQKQQIRPRSPQQAVYLNNISDNDLVFGLGPAGTGKTYLAVV